MTLVDWLRAREWATAAAGFTLECIPLFAFAFAFDLTNQNIGYVAALGLASGLGWWFIGHPVSGVLVCAGRVLLISAVYALTLFFAIQTANCSDDYCEDPFRALAIGIFAVVFTGSALLSAVSAARRSFIQAR